MCKNYIKISDYLYVMDTTYNELTDQQKNMDQQKKISDAKKNIQDIKEVVIDNIDQVLSRGENIENLINDTEMLDQSSWKFNKSSQKLKYLFFLKKNRCYIFFFFAICLVIFFIVLFSCGGLNLNKC